MLSNCGAGKDFFAGLLDNKQIKPVSPKEVNPEYSLEGVMLKLELQSFAI